MQQEMDSAIIFRMKQRRGWEEQYLCLTLTSTNGVSLRFTFNPYLIAWASKQKLLALNKVKLVAFFDLKLPFSLAFSLSLSLSLSLSRTHTHTLFLALSLSLYRCRKAWKYRIRNWRMADTNDSWETNSLNSFAIFVRKGCFTKNEKVCGLQDTNSCKFSLHSEHIFNYFRTMMYLYCYL